MIHLGNVPASTTIYVPFATYAGSTGASVTCTGLAVTDVAIYKNGSVTQRASDAGIALLDTDGIDFDGITGLHGFSIDLSDNTDASFYAVGSWYWVVVSAITVDSQTVTFLAATFRIAPAESITGYPKTDQHALKGDAQSAADLQDFADAGYDPATNKVQGVLLVDTTTTNSDMRGTDSAALAATALSNVQWTNALATALGTAASTVASNLDIAISTIQSQIAALNNLSAKANWFGSLLLEVPDSGTREYIYELVVRDDEDKLTNLDSSPTIALTNAAGTDRSALITTTIANPSTGRYTLTITVGTSTNNESLKLTATGAISGEARYAVIAPQVVDYDNATQVALILTRLGTPSVSVSADIATRASQTSVDDLPTNSELTAALANGVNVTEVDGSTLNTHSIGNFPVDVRDWAGLTPQLAVDAENSLPAVAVLHIHADIISADSVSAAAGAKLADIARRRTQANVEASSDGDALSLGSEYGLIQQAQESNATATPCNNKSSSAWCKRYREPIQQWSVGCQCQRSDTGCYERIRYDCGSIPDS